MTADLGFLIRRPIAHRGLHGLAPGVVENQPAAFAAAIAGNYAIECDVQPTADGDAIVFHDGTLDRLTTAAGPVEALTTAELAKVPFKATGDRMITLAGLFAQVRGRVPLVVEIKSEFDGRLGLTKRVAELAAGYAGPLALMSFDPVPIAWLKANAPSLVRGIVAESHYAGAHWARIPADMRRDLASLAHFGETDPHFLSWRVADLPSAATERCRGSLGRPVICWTVRTDSERMIAAEHADQVTFEGYLA
ncbi:MAG: glycerophosphodiester phosphodiesterase [Phreatobacter sp.]|uniref:glycerophosphodiester phosphodiesterase family protein n=1 Tax=Phreatobacter sp. TaxID=1966341 RepID=UPI001A46FD39|nr:glycerophosphodiester phosphodiesterase family protein [Phreatobacter sp.]MBL8571616.1 glycerophosphodiester phosphodiesterase [Phreatobacter sp.]